MKHSSTTPIPLPPRLSMDEYADFVEASLRESDPARAARQKELEERIRTPFRMAQDAPDAEDGRQIKILINGLPLIFNTLDSLIDHPFFCRPSTKMRGRQKIALHHDFFYL